MSLQPKVGLVIHYDFLWKSDRDAGRHAGKDRPCFILAVSSKANPDGSRNVFVAPIIHTPLLPDRGETGVEIPPKLARHLKLDSDRMWIKTHEINKFAWPEGRLPFGVSPNPRGKFVYGLMHTRVGRRAFDQVLKNSQAGTIAALDRDKSGRE